MNPRPGPFVLATANIKQGQPAAWQAEDVAKVCARADVIGWQDSHQRPEAPATEAGFQTWHPAGVPALAISWRTSRFQLLSTGSVLTHRFQRKVTPNRYVSWVVLRDRATGTASWHVNTWFISKAWTSRPGRRARWWLHNRKLKTVLRALLAHHGAEGTLTGDFNRNRYEAPAIKRMGGRYLWPQHGTRGRMFYDYLVTFGAEPPRAPAVRMAMHSDHDAVFAAVRFKR